MTKKQDDSERRRQLWIYLAHNRELMDYAAGEGRFVLPFSTKNWKEFSKLSRHYKHDPEFRDVLIPGGYEHSINPYFNP